MTIAIEAEKSVLGAVMIDDKGAAEVFSRVDRDDFGFEAHRVIYGAMLKLQGSTKIDPIVLIEELEQADNLKKVGGFAYITDLSLFTPSAANVGQYIDIIQKWRTYRELEAAGKRIAQLAADHDLTALEAAQKEIFDIATRKQDTGIKVIGCDALNAISAYVEDNGKSNIATGFIDIDNMLSGGLRKKTLTVLAARPSIGKTALAMNIARNMAQNNKSVVVFSLEQSRDELLLRLIATQGEIELYSVRLNNNLETMDIAYKSADIVCKLPIYIMDESAITAQKIRAELLKHKLKNPLDMVIIDYLTIMGFVGKIENQNLRIAEIMRSLKSIAMDLDVPVMVLSQLNREVDKRKNATPLLSDLRDSGAIEQDADVVIFLQRNKEEKSGQAELVISKNRNGKTGTIPLYWEGKYFKFKDSTNKYDDDDMPEEWRK